MAVNTCTIWICGCCFMAAVNGEPCQCCADHEEDGPCTGCDQHPDTLMGSISAEDNTTPGIGSSANHDPKCFYWHNGTNAAYDEPCDCNTKDHDTSQCAGCGSYLHGKRHAMTLWIGENKI